MPYCEESLVAKLDPMGTNQFLSAQPCHKEDTTSAHESVNLTMEKGNSISDTEVSASDAFDSKTPANDINAKFDSVSDSKVDESQIMIKCSPLRNLLLMKYLLNLVNLLNLLSHLLR